MHTPRIRALQRSADDRGAITVETALTASVVVFLLAVLAAFGSAALSQIRAGESARIVARAVAAGESAGTARERGLINSPGASISITMTGDTATVTVRNSVSGVGQVLSRGTWTVTGQASTVVESSLTGGDS